MVATHTSSGTAPSPAEWWGHGSPRPCVAGRKSSPSISNQRSSLDNPKIAPSFRPTHRPSNARTPSARETKTSSISSRDRIYEQVKTSQYIEFPHKFLAQRRVSWKKAHWKPHLTGLPWNWTRDSATAATQQMEIQHSRVLQSSSRNIHFATRWELLCCLHLVCTPYFTKELSSQQEQAKNVLYSLFVITQRILGLRLTTFTQISFWQQLNFKERGCPWEVRIAQNRAWKWRYKMTNRSHPP